MAKQSIYDLNEKRRARYHRPENRESNQEKNRIRNGTSVKDGKFCNPYLGLKFNSKAVQVTLTKWGK